MVILFFFLHDGQANAGRLAAEQAEQAFGALLDHIHMHVGDGHAQRGQSCVDGFLRGLPREFLAPHQMPTSSALAALRSCCSKYLLKPICSAIA